MGNIVISGSTFVFLILRWQWAGRARYFLKKTRDFAPRL